MLFKLSHASDFQVLCHVSFTHFFWMHFVTYCHRILHVSHGRGELAEVQLGAVDQRVSKISTAAASTHTCNLPLLIVSHHSCMVLPCRDALDSRNKKSGSRFKEDTCLKTKFIVDSDLFLLIKILQVLNCHSLSAVM